MNFVTILLIIILIIVIIIIVVVIIIIAVNGSQTITDPTPCTNQNDCPSGFVCTFDESSGKNICKSGLGTSCNSNNDCINELQCISSTGSSGSICLQQESIPQRKCKHVTWSENLESEHIIPPNISEINKPKINEAEINVPKINEQVVDEQKINESEILIETKSVSDNDIKYNLSHIAASKPISPEVQIILTKIPDASYIERLPIIMPLSTIEQQDKLDQITIIKEELPKIIITGERNENQEKIVDKSMIETQNSPRKPIEIQSSPRKPTERVVRQYSKDNNLTIVNESLKQSILYKMVNNSTNSTDYEINSSGNTEDQPFDIRSGNSTENNDEEINSIASVSTPCEEKDGVYYCRNEGNGTNDELKNINYHSPVIDVCSYSNATIFLLEDGNVICEIKDQNPKRYRSHNNIKLTRITSFNGYIYGVGKDKLLYNLPNSCFPTINWIWKYSEWAPINIIHISPTHDSSHLWIQTDDQGYLYSNPKSLMSKISYIGMKRVYGRDISHYIDINQSNYSAIVHPSGKLVRNIYDGALSYYDEIMAIHPSDINEYRAITIVNWRPYYIRN